MLKPDLFFRLLLIALTAWACEKEFIPDTAVESGEIIVEGYIEAGDRPAPPYVVLTRSLAFFREINAEEIANNFVHGAHITVTDGERQVVLSELCLAELSPEQQQLAGQLYGIDTDQIGFNFCAYVDLSFSMPGEVGKRYDLKVETESKILTASTIIPFHVPLDSLWFVDPPGEPSDTLAQLRCFVKDPDSLESFFRYFTGINQEPLLSPFSSVFDDRFFDGQSFEFPLAKAEPRTAEFDPSTFGLFRRGDTATIKWATIDEDHYNFWNTLEFNSANQGPFSSYTRIDSNIQGGLGIWGGFSATYYTLLVPEE